MQLRVSSAEINLSNLRQNFDLLKRHCQPDEFFCPMIKANAYGHGAVQVARALESFGVKQVGVVLIEEGIQLRQAGIKTEILIFGDFSTVEAVKAITHHCLTPVISDWKQLELLKAHISTSFAFHIDFNTGMNRLGFDISEATRLSAFLQSHPQFTCIGLMTHLHSSEDLDGAGRQQMNLFQMAVREFPQVKTVHILNSGGLIRRAQNPAAFSALEFRGVRPGLSIYGMRPLQDGDPITTLLKPVMSVKSAVVAIRKVPAGGSVSYGGHWKAQRDSVIGVVPYGYADGQPRHLSADAQVVCREQRMPIVGVVCMDYLMIDLTRAHKSGDPDQWLGESVTLFGHAQLRAEDLANWSETIPYEISTRVSERVPRVYIP